MKIEKWDGKSSDFSTRMTEKGIVFDVHILSYMELIMRGWDPFCGPSVYWTSPLLVRDIPQIVIPQSFFQHHGREHMIGVFWHEVGHVVSDHKRFLPGRFLWMEFEADAYAASRIGTERMCATLAHTLTKLYNDTNEELKARIKLLRELM